MNESDLKRLLDVCKKKVDKGEDALIFLESKFDEEVFLKLENDIKNYINKKDSRDKLNKKYWMLICNPSKWGDGENPYLVNKLLYDLDEERWTINKNTDITHQMKEGHQGIIKVSIDNRGEKRYNPETDSKVEILMSGVYGVFEVVKNKDDKKCTYKTEGGEWFVNIKMIDNFYANNQIVSKEKAIDFLTKKVFDSMTSREISKDVFEKIMKHQEES